MLQTKMGEAKLLVERLAQCRRIQSYTDNTSLIEEVERVCHQARPIPCWRKRESTRTIATQATGPKMHVVAVPARTPSHSATKQPSGSRSRYCCQSVAVWFHPAWPLRCRPDARSSEGHRPDANHGAWFFFLQAQGMPVPPAIHRLDGRIELMYQERTPGQICPPSGRDLSLRAGRWSAVPGGFRMSGSLTLSTLPPPTRLAAAAPAETLASPLLRTMMIAAIDAIPIVVAVRPVGVPLLDPDVWWHLRVGQWVAAPGEPTRGSSCESPEPAPPWPGGSEQTAKWQRRPTRAPRRPLMRNRTPRRPDSACSSPCSSCRRSPPGRKATTTTPPAQLSQRRPPLELCLPGEPLIPLPQTDDEPSGKSPPMRACPRG